jgi:hypothetical protein
MYLNRQRQDVLGFDYEEIGLEIIKHVHVSRDNLTFILHPASNSTDVRPFLSLHGGPKWDTPFEKFAKNTK